MMLTGGSVNFQESSIKLAGWRGGMEACVSPKTGMTAEGGGTCPLDDAIQLNIVHQVKIQAPGKDFTV